MPEVPEERDEEDVDEQEMEESLAHRVSVNHLGAAAADTGGSSPPILTERS